MAVGRNGTGKGTGCKAAHRGGEPPRATWRGGASREARRPSIAPYRNGTEWQMDRATGHERGVRQRGAGTGRNGAEWQMDRATGPDNGARDGRAGYEGRRKARAGRLEVGGGGEVFEVFELQAKFGEVF